MPASKASKASSASGASLASGVASKVLRIFLAGGRGEYKTLQLATRAATRAEVQMLSLVAYADGRMPTMLPEVQWP